MKITKKQKIQYILAGTLLLLLAFFVLFLLLRQSGKPMEAGETTPTSAPTAVPASASETVRIAGKTVELSAGSFDLSGVFLSAEDCAQIASLSRLTTLSLKNCGLSDIGFLAALTGLKTLYLPDNRIADVAPLAGLSSLSTLYLDNNPVSNFAPLTGLSQLTTLSIKGITILDSELKTLKESLPSCSIFSDNVIESARPISLGGLTFTEDVQTLDLSNRGISDISKLAYCHHLTELDLSGNPVENIAVLSVLPQLTRLNLFAVGLQDEALLPLTSLQNLRWLNLQFNPNLTAEGLDVLKLALPNCEIWHDEVFYKLTFADRTFTSDATEMDITACGVLSLAGLEKFTRLQRLIVFGNGLTELSALTFLQNLQELDAGYNNLADISGLSGHTGLRKLSLAHNAVTDIYPLASCTGLEELDLSYNSINYLTHLEGLSHLKVLNITGNPGITVEQVLSLQKMLPDCTIITDLPLPEPIPEFTPEP